MQYTVTVDDADSSIIEAIAREKGYPSVSDYLRALIEADAFVEALREDWQDAERSADDIEAGFRQGWHEIATGHSLSLDELWASLDDDE